MSEEYNDKFKVNQKGVITVLPQATFNGSMIVPSEINGKRVLTIGDNFIKHRKDVANIIIEDGIEKIDSNAFWGCKRLKSIELPKTLKSIGVHAFAETGLKEIDMSKAKDLQPLHLRAFADCRFLESIKFPTKIQGNVIGYECFTNCEKLEKIVLPQNITEIAPKTFQNCISLKCIDIPKSVEIISRHAFSRSGITELYIPKNVKKIEPTAFLDCSNLRKAKIDAQISFVEYNTFTGCNNLEDIVLPEGLKEINFRAFQGCVNLKNVNIPLTVKRIDAYAFAGTAIKKIKLPKKLRAINLTAFNSCNNLKEIIIPSNVRFVSIPDDIDISNTKIISESTKERFEIVLELKEIIDNCICLGDVKEVENVINNYSNNYENVAKNLTPATLEYISELLNERLNSVTDINKKIYYAGVQNAIETLLIASGYKTEKVIKKEIDDEILE